MMKLKIFIHILLSERDIIRLENQFLLKYFKDFACETNYLTAKDPDMIFILCVSCIFEKFFCLM